MEPRINIITLGVKDLERSREFYEDLGWLPSSVSNENIAIFRLGGVALCLYPEKLLAEDATVDPQRMGFRGVTIAYNVASKSEVADILREAEAAGANIVKPAQDVFWGGHSGYFADPDGHLWEIAWNPHWPLVNGQVAIPD